MLESFLGDAIQFVKDGKDFDDEVVHCCVHTNIKGNSITHYPGRKCGLSLSSTEKIFIFSSKVCLKEVRWTYEELERL